ncbi:hypothetical protein BW36_01382 [Micrococcus luteus]|uniref:hypothetical protein n=1 Tax=Micrococcus luteus TaxID=1270 RepID=UPI00044DE2AE|nr:hypothetical protein [Micrococcus luteus]EZP37908.1 hypothetical protein BW36_01382 [Micrococcus luteus]
MNTTTRHTWLDIDFKPAPSVPELIAALQSLHAELSAIRADLAADTAKEQNP